MVKNHKQTKRQTHSISSLKIHIFFFPKKSKPYFTLSSCLLSPLSFPLSLSPHFHPFHKPHLLTLTSLHCLFLLHLPLAPSSYHLSYHHLIQVFTKLPHLSISFNIPSFIEFQILFIVYFQQLRGDVCLH